MSQQPQTQQPKKRGTALTAWIAIMVLLNALAAVLYILLAIGLATNNFALTKTINASTTVSLWAMALLSILAIVNVASAVALSKLKKWGFFAFVTSNLALIVIDLSVGITTSGTIGLLGFRFGIGLLAIGAVLGIATLWVLMRPKNKMLN